MVAPIVLIAILTIGANMFTDAVARTALGIEAPIAPPAMLGSESDRGSAGRSGRGGRGRRHERRAGAASRETS